MLDQQVGSTDFTRCGLRDLAQATAVVFGHVVLELVDIGALGRLPSRRLLGGVEVVGEVLAIAVTHFPVRGQTGLLYERTIRW